MAPRVGGGHRHLGARAARVGRGDLRVQHHELHAERRRVHARAHHGGHGAVHVHQQARVERGDRRCRRQALGRAVGRHQAEAVAARLHHHVAVQRGDREGRVVVLHLHAGHLHAARVGAREEVEPVLRGEEHGRHGPGGRPAQVRLVVEGHPRLRGGEVEVDLVHVGAGREGRGRHEARVEGPVLREVGQREPVVEVAGREDVHVFVRGRHRRERASREPHADAVPHLARGGVQQRRVAQEGVDAHGEARLDADQRAVPRVVVVALLREPAAGRVARAPAALRILPVVGQFDGVHDGAVAVAVEVARAAQVGRQGVALEVLGREGVGQVHRVGQLEARVLVGVEARVAGLVVVVVVERRRRRRWAAQVDVAVGVAAQVEVAVGGRRRRRRRRRAAQVEIAVGVAA